MEREINANELGFGSSYESFKVVSIDNGTDTAGTGATGAFVTKSFSDGKVSRELFAPEFEGVILLSRAKLTEKGKTQTWRTAEFNPINTQAQIPILSLIDGMPVKDANGNYKVAFATMDEIKSKMSFTTPRGVERTYNYLVVLYVYVPAIKETVKLVFKGTGRGKFYDYLKMVSSKGMNVFDIVTKFTNKLDEYSKYAVNFELAMGEDGKVKRAPADIKVSELQESILGAAKRVNDLYALGTPDAQSKLMEGEAYAISAEDIPFEG